MKEGRNNTILLTVIGIATLLVAVAGATFAYFTAQIRYHDTNSVLTITAGQGTSASLIGTRVELKDIYPKGTAGTLGNDDAWATKVIKITNTTPEGTAMGKDIEYKLTLNYTSSFSANSIYYTVTPIANSEDAAVCVDDPLNASATCSAYLKAYTSTAEQMDNLGTATETAINYTGATDAEGGKKVGTVDLVNGSLKIGSNGYVHAYYLRIYFPNTGKVQNADQDKSFVGTVSLVQTNK